MAQKRKHASLDTKLQAIAEVEKDVKSMTEIAKAFDIPLSTLSTWLKNKDAIRQNHNSCAPACKHMRTTKHTDIDQALLIWFKNARSENIPMSGPLIQEKARYLAKELGIDDFAASDGWLSHFKCRHDINFRVISGELQKLPPANRPVDVYYPAKVARWLSTRWHLQRRWIWFFLQTLT